MARAFNGSSQYLINGTAAATAEPLSMACWFKTSSDTANQALMALGSNTTTTRQFELRCDGSQAGDPVVAASQQSGVIGANTTTGYTVNQWHHAAGVWNSTTDRRAFIDGGSKGTNTTARTNSAIDRTVIGAKWLSSGASLFLAGSIAECAIWNDDLTDSEVAILATGVSPLFVHPQNLIFYMPGIRDIDQDIVGARAMTAVASPTVDEHPRVRLCISPFTRFTAAAGGAAITPSMLNRIEREITRGYMRGVMRGAA
jgi:hypothetical protein